MSVWKEICGILLFQHSYFCLWSGLHYIEATDSVTCFFCAKAVRKHKVNLKSTDTAFVNKSNLYIIVYYEVMLCVDIQRFYKLERYHSYILFGSMRIEIAIRNLWRMQHVYYLYVLKVTLNTISEHVKFKTFRRGQALDRAAVQLSCLQQL